MKRKKQPISILDLGRVPGSERKNTPGYETKAQFFAREAREAREKVDGPLRKVQNELNSALRENAANVAHFFSSPIEKLLNSSASSAPVDFGLGSFAEQTEDQTDDARRAVLAQFGEASQAQGFDLSEQGWMRFFRYAKLQSHLQRIAITLDFLQACLVRLGELGCLNDEVVAGELPKRAKAAKPQSETKSSDVIDYLLESTPAESHVWKKVVAQGWTADFSKWLYAWIESLKKTFNYDFDVDELGRKAAAFIDRRNLSPFSYSTWDRCRVAFVRSGDFPNHMLTDQERLCEYIEASPSLNDYEARRDIQRRAQELIDAGPTPPPHK